MFINDIIHMTQGELLVKYWYIWLAIILTGIIIKLFDKIKNK